MRIIRGKFGGRRFSPPAKNWPTRPTTDFSKEALFNILENQLDFSAIKMLDLFGGTGNHCFEFISRGCLDTTYVDKHGPAVSFVMKLSKELEISEAISINKMDVRKFIKQSTQNFDYIFAGPPYGLPWLDDIPALIDQARLLRPNGLFVLEHNQHHNFSDYDHFEYVRSYGQTHFSFFSGSTSEQD